MVARQFSVSETTIRKWAKLEQWPQRAEDLRRKATEKNTLRTLEQQARQNARILVAAGDRLERRLVSDAELDDALVVRAYETADRINRLNEGLVTERTEKISFVVKAVYQTAAKYVPAEQRRPFLDELDAAVRPLALEAGE